MSAILPSRRIILSVLVIVALVTSGLTIYLRINQQRLDRQNQKLLDEISDLQSRQKIPVEVRQQPSILLDASVSDKTALSFYWFGDMDSHFRDPINFYVVPGGDSKWHKVEVPDKDDQVSVFVSAAEMKQILESMKTLGLRWSDSHGREVFPDTFHRKGTDMLDITLVSADSTAKTHIRIARMCDQLDKLDSVMPSPRILWQFQTFRWDNGCYIRGYDNSAQPPEF
jgi:hypothetical protein